MATNLDPKMLAGFAQEMQSALRTVRDGVESFVHDPQQQEALEDAYQCMQSIKDASTMLNLPVLSQLLGYVEEMVEEVATATLPLPALQSTALRQVVEALEDYVHRALAGEGQEQLAVQALVQAYRRFKALPESSESAALEDLVGAPGPAPLVPAASALAVSDGAEEAAAAELIEGFLLEAEDYLNTIGRLLPALDKAPDPREALQQVRRSVHTFKGAAGVVGFRPVSQLAHRMEDLLDQLYEGRCNLTPAWHDLLLRTFDVLDEFVRAHGCLPSFDTVAAGLYQAYDRVFETPPVGETPPGAAAAPLDEASAELLEGFLHEAEEYIQSMGQMLHRLATTSEPRACWQSMRRSVHTFKGAAGVVGCQAASQLGGRMEALLDELLEGRRECTPQVTDLLCATFDALDAFIQQRGRLATFEATAETLQEAYRALAAGATVLPLPAAPRPAAGALEAPERPVAAAAALAGARALPPGAGAGLEVPDLNTQTVTQLADVLRVPLDRVDELVRLVSELVISRSSYEQHLGHLIHQVDELRLSIERLRRTSTTIETQYEVRALGGQNLLTPSALGPPPSSTGASANATEFDALELDRYSEFTLVARELTETTADIGALGQEFNDLLGDFDGYLTRQSRLTSEIQDKMMRLRMVPMATLATRLHRAVRVTARQRAKEAELVLEGEDVDFDKTMLEEMAEPLLHLLRNAVDHGIERPEVRQQAGKPRQGRIHLRAFREGTQVVLQLRDDGAGLDPQRLRAVALRNGLLSEAESAHLSDAELYPLILRPGFSTASEVSEISGRGVGMDVVQATVSRLKGHMTIDSTPGQGVTCTMRLPLTLAITRVLLVKAHGETFAIPLADVTQIMRLEAQDIERVGGVPSIRLEKQVVPVVRLGERLQLAQPAESTPRTVPIVVVQAGDQQVALIVDELLGGREVVVKTLGSHLRRVHGVIGSTLMGDGSVVLILNPVELARDDLRPGSSRQTELPKARPARASEVLEVLIVDDSFSVRRVVSNLVKSMGWRPLLAKDGLEALAVLQQATTPPDVILLDVEMPQMDGYEFTSTIRAQAAYRDLPVVMLTSRSGEKHRRKAFEVGATEYLVKPYQDEVLINTIRRLASPAHGESAA
ncbi:MAG: Hpt domain-containing protein [Candidatus Tectimicrobiota bacterium]